MRLIQRTMVHLCPALGYMAPHLKLDLEQDQGGGGVGDDSDVGDGGGGVDGDVMEGHADGPTAPKLSVGFLSAHMKFHSVGRLLAGVVTNLDHNLFDVTVFDCSSPSVNGIGAGAGASASTAARSSSSSAIGFGSEGAGRGEGGAAGGKKETDPVKLLLKGEKAAHVSHVKVSSSSLATAQV